MTFMSDIFTALNSLYGIPADVLIALSCIVLGYILRAIPDFPNRGIPLACVLWAMVLNPILSAPPGPGMSLRQWVVRNALAGMIIGFAAWVFHKAIIARFEDKVPGLKTLIGEDGEPKIDPSAPVPMKAPVAQPSAPTPVTPVNPVVQEGPH